VVRVFLLTIILAVSYSSAVSKLRRPFLSNRYFFITVRRPQDWPWSSFNEYSGISADEQKRRCGLIIDRVRMPSVSMITSKPALRAGHANLIDHTPTEKPQTATPAVCIAIP
jgi:hypothetical protein